jgi:hypothetical protein
MAAGLREGLAVKEAIKRQWVKDLRSGEFEQGTSYLEKVDDGVSRLCCLGVLCRQAVKAGIIPEPELHSSSYYYLDDDTDHEGVTGESFNQRHALPRKVAEWAGVPYGSSGGDVVIEPGGDVDEGDFTAIAANDGVGMSFAEIADLIEKNVPVE